MTTAIVILLVLFVLNGIFAMSELAVMTSRQSRLHAAARRGSKGAGSALALAREPTKFLSTVQVGITLIGILAGAFGEKAISGEVGRLVASVPVLEPHAELISLIIVVVLITYFSLVLGELVPKRIAMAYPEAVATLIARPLTLLSVVAAWPVKLLTVSTEAILKVLHIRPKTTDDVSEEDVRALMARAASTGIFTPHEQELFQRTMRVGDLTVRDLMVARSEIVWIDETETIETVRVLVGTCPHSHFPVCRGTIDQLVGVVHIKDLISYGLLTGASFSIASVATKPLFVPETTPALDMLARFRSGTTHIAFVVDEYGVTMGLVTINDVTGAIVGDIRRPGDAAAPRLKLRDDGSWLVDGRVPLHELLDGLDADARVRSQAPDVSTAGGLLFSVLGHLPREGQTVVWCGLQMEVVDMDGTRVDKLIIRKLPDAPE